MSNIPSTAQSLPWYHYPMMWLVIMLPLIVVVASVSTMVIAYQNAPVTVITSDKPAKGISPVKPE